MLFEPFRRLGDGRGDFDRVLVPSFLCTFLLAELSVRVETKGGSCSGSAGTDQLPNTPRSKHSATEQRRRSKINDRSVAIAPDLIQKWLAVLFLSFDCLRVLDV